MNHPFQVFVGTVLSICFSGTLAFGQKPATSPDDLPTFSARSELVLVPVAVLEKGKAVAGLKKEQFLLEDNGHRRQISFFQEFENAPAASTAKLAAHEYTNYLPGAPADQNVRLIVLDLINTPFLSQPEMSRAREGIVKFLSENVDPNEPTALLLMTIDGLKQVHSFNTNPDVLIAALKGAQKINRGPSSEGMSVAPLAGHPASGGASLDAAVASEMGVIAQALNNADAGFAELARRRLQLDTLRNFEAIALAYRGIPGRKSLLWVTFGVQLPRTGSDAKFTGLIIQRLNGANISVYPLDIMGLAFPFERPDPLGNMSDPRTGPGLATRQSVTLDTRRGILESFQLIAQETAGATCLNNNDIHDCIVRAHNDSRTFYMLGFYVPSQDRTPGWHKIKVEVNAQFSELRYRQGYLINSPAQGKEQDKAFQPTIKQAINTPFDFTSVPIQVALIGTTPDNGRSQLKYRVTLPPGSFSINDNVMHVQFSVVVLDDKGKYVTEQSKNIRGVLKAETLSRLSAEGFSYEDKLELARGEYQLKWIVRDELSGDIGSVTAPIDVH
jgi:VWFA-related protein